MKQSLFKRLCFLCVLCGGSAVEFSRDVNCGDVNSTVEFSRDVIRRDVNCGDVNSN